jgi:6-phosphofructokinase
VETGKPHFMEGMMQTVSPIVPKVMGRAVGYLAPMAGIASAAAAIVIPEPDVVPATAVLHSDGLYAEPDRVSRRRP